MSEEKKSVLIVGAGSAIGRLIAEKLHKQNTHIYAISRNDQSYYKKLNIKAQKFDILEDDPEKLNTFLPEKLSGLVYCPGTINLKPFNRLTDEDFLNDYRINFLGAVNAIRMTIPNLRKGKPSSVVLFSSVAAQLGLNFHASIASAKAAVESLGRSLAAEYANSKIRFNIISPSLTDTPLAEQLLNSDQKRESSAKRHPLKEIGNPNDMAEAATFLLSENSAWITGQVINIDGGLSTLKTF